MASPELTSQQSFSFEFVGIRLDPDASAPFLPPRLAWVVGQLDDVRLLAGSSATAGWPLPPGGDAPTSAPPHMSSSSERLAKGISGGVFF
ncbi:hypothetical protein ACQJBY_008685 [Aegilops geniculata]